MSLEVDVRARRDGFVVDAAFSAAPGETVALLGPNGAGKSTIVEALAGLLPPASGRVVLDGRSLDDTAADLHVPARQRPIGVLFQDLLLLPHLSALENVAFPLRARGVGAADARSKAREALEHVGALAQADERPGRISGGEAQRVALARALVTGPRLLLLDEPLSALDVSSKTRIRSLLRSVLAAFGGVAVLVTHDPVDAMTLAARLVVIEGGRVTQTGTPAQIRAAPRTPYAADLVGVNLFVGRLEIDEGIARIRTEEGEVVCAAPTEPRDLAGPVEGAMGILRPADVSLFLERPAGSARNVFAGPVSFVTVEGDRARVGVGSSPSLVAEVTLASLRGLGIAEGTPVWASFKALEVRVLLP